MLSTFLLMTTVSLAAKPEIAVVGVHVQGLSDEKGEEAATYLGEGLSGSADVDVVLPQYVSARLKGREELVLADMAFAAGKKRLDEGRVLYERAQPDAAIPQLEKATVELSRGISTTGQTQDLIEAYLVLGLAYSGMGQDDEARRAFRRVVVLDPNRELDPISYPPRVIDLYNQERTQILAAKAGTLLVKAEMPPSEDGSSRAVRVTIDGRDEGVAPLNIASLPPGNHYVFADADGGYRAFSEVNLSAGQELNLELVMVPGTLGVASESAYGRSEEAERLYRAVGEYCQTPLILIAGQVGEDEVAVQLYSTRTGTFSQSLQARSGGDPVRAMNDLIPSLVRFINDSGEIAPDRVSIDVAPIDVSTNAVLTQLLLDPDEELQVQLLEQGGPKWWFWAGLGAVVAGGAATTTALLLLNDDVNNNGTITFGPIPQ